MELLGNDKVLNSEKLGMVDHLCWNHRI